MSPSILDIYVRLALGRRRLGNGHPSPLLGCESNETMRPVLALAVAATLASTSCAQNFLEWDDPEPNGLLTGPYVLLTGPDSAIVGFRAPGSERAEVRWTSTDGQKGTSNAASRKDLFSAQLRSLPRGPTIDYEVVLDGKPVTKGQFRVSSAPDEKNIRFAVFGDTRNGHAVHRDVIMGITRETKVDFVLNTGDMVQNGGKPNEWITFFQIERPLLAKMPMLPTTGNHDVSGREYYERFFFLDQWSGGKRYFAHDWGNLRVIALDNGIECNRACAQFNYVRQALADGAKQNKLMVMFLHHSPYSSGYHGVDVGVAQAIGELAETYGVELVVSGHDHHYERTKPIKGTTYVVSGSSGAPIRPVRPHEWTAHARTEPHYVLVDVDGDRMSMRAVNLRGEAFDSGVIEPNPPKSTQAPAVTPPAPAASP